MTEGDVSASAHLYIGDDNGIPVHQLKSTNETTSSEERIPKDQVFDTALVGNVLQHYEPKNWFNTDVAYQMTRSDIKRFEDYVRKVHELTVHGRKAIEKIQSLSLNAAASQAKIQTWINKIRVKRHKSYRGTNIETVAHDWLRNGITPERISELLEIHKNLNPFVNQRLEKLKNYIEKYNRMKGTKHTLLETLVYCYQKKPKSITAPSKKRDILVVALPKEDGKLETALPKKDAKLAIELSEGDARLAIGLSRAKMSVFTVEEATELQKELLNSWLTARVSVDAVFRTLKKVSRKNFFLYENLDTFVEYVELLKINSREKTTDALTYLRERFDEQDIVRQLERAGQDGPYHKGFMQKLSQT